jgi:predicted nucleic acid-binding protein
MASPSDNIDFLKDKISLDSNIIIDFFENSYEETIKRVFRKKVYFSIFILREISRYDLSIFDYDELDIKGEEEIEYFNNMIYKFSNKLSEDDIHLITVCKFNGLCCASNEKDVRTICKEEGIRVLGSISVLMEAIKIKAIDNKMAKSMLNNMKKSTMYLDEALYAETIRNFEKLITFD